MTVVVLGVVRAATARNLECARYTARMATWLNAALDPYIDPTTAGSVSSSRRR